MAAHLTIDRSNLGRDDLVIGDDPDTGYTLGKEISLGAITWKKTIAAESNNVPGRVMTDFARASTTAAGSIVCHGDDEEDLQSKLRRIIRALTQVKNGQFHSYTMAYHHGAAVYKWRNTEPADVTPGDAEELDDEAMTAFIQPVRFTVVRHPIAILGPI